MNIAFWSNSKGVCGTSLNMIVTGVFTSVLYSMETNLIQLGKERQSLEEVFEGRRMESVINDEFSFYNKRGMDELFDSARLDIMNQGLLDSNLINVRHTNIFYMPGLKKNIEELDKSENFIKILEHLKSNKKINLIDTSNGENDFTKEILNQSDIIVVNISQGDYSVLPEWFLEKFLEKSIFLIGKYDMSSKINLNYIRKSLDLSKDKIGVIPYNIQCHDAVSQGKIVPFIMKNIFSKKHENNFEFINNVFKSANMILKKAGVDGI